MCGIAGYLDLDMQKPASVEVLRAMTDSIQHRGPDADGAWTEGSIGLGHRRLSIIDLNTGQQPMSSSDGRLMLTFNGEIYNYIELRTELRKRGARFKTDSDSEVILAAYDEWGTRCVNHFNGMWAFAIWDRSRKRLFCSRDRMGEKPFFYAVEKNTLVFGSEIKALFAYGMPREPNWEVLDALLSFLYIPAPHTFFNNIFKLPPGHSLIVENGVLNLECYYDIPAIPDAEMENDESKILASFEELFFDSVKIRMRSDVPFGAFLSGGLDSASVVAAMSEASTNPVITCTIGFTEKAFDERDLAREVADMYGTTHNESEVNLDDALHLMKQLAWHYDEPFGDSSALPTFIVSKIAREKVKMVLTGDGGDEVLSGYRIHHREYSGNFLRAMPDMLSTKVLPFFLDSLQLAPSGKIQRYARHYSRLVRRSALELPNRIMEMQNGFSTSQRNELLNLRNDVRPAREFVDDIINPLHKCSNFTRFNYWMSRISLPDDMLCKVDRASMANGLETRIPFLDHRLVDLLAGVPPQIKLKRLVRKSVLRETLGKRLPSSLLTAAKKGFSVPLAKWISSDDYLERRSRMGVEASGMNLAAFESILGGQKNGSVAAENGLWTLGMLSFAFDNSKPSKRSDPG